MRSVTRQRVFWLVAGVALLLMVSPPGYGSGPRSVDGTGQPMKWNNVVPIVYNPDLGSLGTLTNGEADALVSDAFARWSGIPQVQLAFTAGPELPQNINATGLPATNPAHWGHFWRKDLDGLSPVIYDTDGTITDDMFGVGAKFDVLGAAGLDSPIALAGTITEASIVLNGAFLDGAGLPGSPTDSVSQLAFEATMVHEVGHFLNLDHSLVNHELAGDFDPDNDIYIATMYPLTVEDEEAIASPNPDDAAGAIALYPAAGAAAATWSLAGGVSAGGVPFQGAEIIIRKSNDPLMYAYEAITGAKFFPCNVGGVCYPCDPYAACSAGDPPAQGAYSVSGMLPGSYTVCVEQLDRRVSLGNGTFIGPLATPPTLPGPEECYDAGESADPSLDDPDTSTVLNQIAGTSATGIDITLDEFVAADTFEPNESLAAAKDLPGLVALQPRDTIGALLGAGDLDFYKVSVVAGHTYRIDVDASEIGSTLDPLFGLYDGTGASIQVVDDAVDPDSGMQTPDPAITWKANFTGLLRIAVSSFPDSDLNGQGGTTTGPYWLRVIDDTDADGDGIADRVDICPADPLDDADGDGVCANADNCPQAFNPGQENTDADSYGNACDHEVLLEDKADYLNGGFSLNGRYGAGLSGVGDINGDGRADYGIGAPVAGRVEFFAFARNWLKSRASLIAGPGFGASIAPAGNYDCLVYDDVAVGFPEGGTFSEALIMPSTDTSIDLFGQDFYGTTDGFGRSIALVGDVNGGGAKDLAVGQPDTSNGSVALFYFEPSCSVPDTVSDWSMDGEQAGSLFGTSVASAGSVNGDAYADLLVGAPGHDNGQGKAYVFLGHNGSGLSMTADWMAESDEAGADFGRVVAGVGDVNDDGFDDIMVGAPLADGTLRGRVFLYLGTSTGPANSPALQIDGDQDGARFGSAVAGVGDLNNDGYDDVVVGTPYHDASGVDRGRVYLFLGSASGLSTTPAVVLSGTADNSHFGAVVAGPGDLDGDGTGDLLVAAPEYANVGRVSVFLGGDKYDPDGDGVAGVLDICRDVYNPTQQDSDVAAGPDGTCLTVDDNPGLYGPDGLCGTTDDLVGDRVGDACRVWTVSAPLTSLAFRSGGGAWADYDNDGDLDLWLPGVTVAPTASEKLVRNDGNGNFTNVTPAAMSSSWTAGVWGDYDNDGDADLWSVSDSGNRLLQNNGAGVFTPVVLNPALSLTKKASPTSYFSTATVINYTYLVTNNGGTTLSGPVTVTDDKAVVTCPAGGLARGASMTCTASYSTRAADMIATSVKNTAQAHADGLDSYTDSATVVRGSGGLPVLTGSNSVAWVDYDRDGDLDAYVTGNPDGRIYRNDGGNTFTLITIAPLDSFPPTASTWADYDNDGDQDVLLIGGFCRMYRNDLSGVFTAVTLPSGLNCTNAAWGDFDNDSDLDISAGTSLLQNVGNGTFSPLPDFVDSVGSSAASGHWVDHENDGDLDFITSATVYRNDGNGNFSSVRELSISYARMVPADFDEDGRVDLFLPGTASTGVLRSRLVRNEASSGHWLEVELTPTVSGGSAIGSQVRAITGGVTRLREVTSAGNPSQAARRIHFGLGDAGVVETLTIRWPSGAIQTLSEVAVDQLITVIEADGTSPSVTAVFPQPGAVDASLYTNIILQMNESIDPATADNRSISISHGGVKAAGSLQVSADRLRITFDPDGPLDPDADYQIEVSADLRDLSGNPAVPFSSGFDTGPVGGSAPLPAAAVGTQQSGTVIGGQNLDDHSGFSNAALGDVNGDGVSDLVIGSPNSDDGANVDAGKATLVFGRASLQIRGGPVLALQYVGEGISNQAGRAVAAAGDMNGDGKADFLIGAPYASPNGAGSGKAYLVFGNPSLDEVAPAVLPLADLAACATPTLCGIAFLGEAPGDLAGIAMTDAGDINNDGYPDILVGAPSASPGGRTGAGKVYLIYGPLMTPGTIPLSSVGVTQPGIVFNGENAGDNAGASLSRWDQFTGDGVDDLLIGAPNSDAQSEFGSLLPDAGYVYAIHGGTANLVPNPVSPATIELSRLANASGDQVFGFVFIGVSPNHRIGRAVTGAVDINGNGVPDIIIGSNLQAWIIPGDGPKTQSGSTKLTTTPTLTPTGLIRSVGTHDAMQQFGATVFTPGAEGNIGEIAVAPAGDLNGDGIGDLIMGAGDADVPGKTDAGKAWIIFGSTDFPSGEILLSDVGGTFPGVVLQGAEAGDRFGSSVSGGYDVTGDGVADVLVGSPFADSLPASPTDAGETYIISFRAAGEVVELVASQPVSSPGAIFLEWSVANRAVKYNVYRGQVSTLAAAGGVRTSNMVQFACGIATDSDSDTLPDTEDATTPAAGQAFFYLVTGRNLTGEGPLGAGTPARVLDAQCP